MWEITAKHSKNPDSRGLGRNLLCSAKVLTVADRTGKMLPNYCDDKKKKEKASKWPDENTKQSEKIESLRTSGER